MMTKTREALTLFLESCRLERSSADLTISAYSSDLEQFASFFAKTKPLEKISPCDVETYLTNLKKRKLAGASISRKASAIRQFFKFCVSDLDLSTNPSGTIPMPTAKKKLPKALPKNEIEQLLKAAASGLPYKQKVDDLISRDRAMIFLLYASGLRVSELLGLRAEDIDLEQGYCRVKGKGGKERIAPFAEVAGEHLHHFLYEHRPNLDPKSPHLFVNSKGFVLTRQAFWRLIKKISLIAGCRSDVSPHSLRHSFATHLLESGMNLRSLQMLLGHSDLATTQIYTNVTPSHLKETHRKYHPKGE